MSGGLLRGFPKMSVTTDVAKPLLFKMELVVNEKSYVVGSVNNGLLFQNIDS